MAACDFDLLFTFVMAGWEGAAHDTRIFLYAIRRQSVMLGFKNLGLNVLELHFIMLTNHD